MLDAECRMNNQSWPSPQDYNEAVQNARHNFSDPVMSLGSVETNALGLPKSRTGSFASVYKLEAKGQTFAVRCFLRNIQDQRERYRLLANHLSGSRLASLVLFEYVEDGVRVGNRWFPVQKMEWVEGDSLDEFVRSHLHDSAMLRELSKSFVEMCRSFRTEGIAHGDLQHGNIIVQCQSPRHLRALTLRVVDYDNMFVPAMRGMVSNELGHRNYQHPQRSREHFDGELDNFSAWVIYASLRALAIEPSLYPRLLAGDDCLLFKRADFCEPTNSCSFAALERSGNDELRKIGRFVRHLLSLDPESIQPLSEDFANVDQLADLDNNSPDSRGGGALDSNWLSRENSRLLLARGTVQEQSSQSSNSQSAAVQSPSQSVSSKTAIASGSPQLPVVGGQLQIPSASLPLAAVISPPRFTGGPSKILFSPSTQSSSTAFGFPFEIELHQNLPRNIAVRPGLPGLGLFLYRMSFPVFFLMLFWAGQFLLENAGLVVVWLLAVGFTAHYDRRVQRLVKHGVAVMGVVTDKKVESDSESTNYWITYTYERDGGVCSGRWDCNAQQYGAYMVGDRLTILWDPEDWSNVSPYKGCIYEARAPVVKP